MLLAGKNLTFGLKFRRESLGGSVNKEISLKNWQEIGYIGVLMA